MGLYPYLVAQSTIFQKGVKKKKIQLFCYSSRRKQTQGLACISPAGGKNSLDFNAYPMSRMEPEAQTAGQLHRGDSCTLGSGGTPGLRRCPVAGRPRCCVDRLSQPLQMGCHHSRGERVSDQRSNLCHHSLPFHRKGKKTFGL